MSSNSFMYVSPNEETAIWWDKLAYLGLPFIPTALFQFTIFALRIYSSQQRKAWTGWILSFFFPPSPPLIGFYQVTNFNRECRTNKPGVIFTIMEGRHAYSKWFISNVCCLPAPYKL
jgi:RimJ/RimL family protein N-acetyltransferase